MNLINKFISWVFGLETKVEPIKKPKPNKPRYPHPKISEEGIPDFCQFLECKTRLTIFEYKKCKYCQGHFCIKHTAPSENHNCKGVGPRLIPNRGDYKRLKQK